MFEVSNQALFQGNQIKFSIIDLEISTFLEDNEEKTLSRKKLIIYFSTRDGQMIRE